MADLVRPRPLPPIDMTGIIILGDTSRNKHTPLYLHLTGTLTADPQNNYFWDPAFIHDRNVRGQPTIYPDIMSSLVASGVSKRLSSHTDFNSATAEWYDEGWYAPMEQFFPDFV